MSLSDRLKDLKLRRPGSRHAFRQWVVAQEREMGSEQFTHFMDELNRRIFALVNGDPSDKLVAITIIDELIDVQYEGHGGETKILKFASYLRMVLPAADSVEVLVPVSKALGHLARAGGTVTAGLVESEVRRALEWLQGDRVELKRFAAVLVLKELAENAPTLFNVHVAAFLDYVWVALRDSKLMIRQGAIEALRACLVLISKRANRWRVQWYYKVFNQATSGLQRVGTPESIHGSLLTFGELLRNSGEFMLARFKEVCEIVLKNQDHKDRLVRTTVVSLLPRLAHFCPEAFVRGYLDVSLDLIILQLRSGHVAREVVFDALGEVALAVKGHIRPRLDVLVTLIKEHGLQPSSSSRKTACPEALLCVGQLSVAVGEELSPHLNDLVDQMFHSGLSATLVKALTAIVKNIPQFLAPVQERLLSIISSILLQRNTPTDASSSDAHRVSVYGAPSGFLRHTPTTSSSRVKHTTTAQADKQLTTLALNTLGTFNFRQHDLLPFARETVSSFLDDDNPAIRQSAALTCSRLLLQADASRSRTRSLHTGRLSKGHRHRFHNSVVCELLERLLTVGIADPDPVIRKTVLSSLDERFDNYLAQSTNLSSLFIALNDEVFEIRCVAMTIIGRLTAQNPAYVMPSLRTTLIQLLTEVQFSKEKTREESAQLLGHLISAADSLIRPYVQPVLGVLLPKLSDPDTGVASSVLATLGQLATVGQEDMVVYLDQLIPLIVNALNDSNSNIRREVALRTLGQLAYSTGYVIEPFLKYKELLPTILNVLKDDASWAVRREVVRVLGIIGALDPSTHKLNEQALREQEYQQQSQAKGKKALQNSTSLSMPEVLPLNDFNAASEEYYPTVAINALMNILRQPSIYHNMVIDAIMFIFKSLGLKCVPFLPHIIPSFLHVMRVCDDALRESLFMQLGTLVSIVQQHIRNYLDGIFQLVHLHLYCNKPHLLPAILSLVQEISTALRDEFKVYLPDLLPQLLAVLNTDYSNTRSATVKVLHALETFGSTLDDHLFLLIPPLVRLCTQNTAPLSVRRQALRTLSKLCCSLNFSAYISRVVHPLVRVLDGSIVELRMDAMHALCCMLFQLGADFAIFIPTVDKVMHKHNIRHGPYQRLVSKLLKSEPFLDSDFSPNPEPDAAVPAASANNASVRKLGVNQQNLKKAWEASQRSTKDDWLDWMRCLSVELLKESPSPALRACSSLAQKHPALARELFNAAFVSCWNELFDQYQDDLVRALESAFKSVDIPADILQTLLYLAEFMEHNSKTLPIDIKTLGQLASSCHSYAKALHYKELEFQMSPESDTIEALIALNNQLQQPEAAVGVLTYAQQRAGVHVKELWYEKLHRWEEALEAYERKQLEAPDNLDVTLGRLRCLKSLGEWERLAQLSHDLWVQNADVNLLDVRKQIAPLACSAAWNLGRWESMEQFLTVLGGGVAEGSFFRAILAVHRNSYNEAQRYIDSTRLLLDTELTALVGESYNRSYRLVVEVQQLAELEEVVVYKRSSSERQKAHIRQMWCQRLSGCQQSVTVWQQVLSVRCMVMSPTEDVRTWLQFSKLCRKHGRLALSLKVLMTLLGFDPAKEPHKLLSPDHASPTHFLEHSRVALAFLQHQWAAGFRAEALGSLQKLSGVLRERGTKEVEWQSLTASSFLKLGHWQREMEPDLTDTTLRSVLSSYKVATACDSESWKAWHALALMNYQAVVHYEGVSGGAADEKISVHLVPALEAFFRCIQLDRLGPDTRLQDVLRLLNLWFRYGSRSSVEQALIRGFNAIPVDTWLQVIPQIIARIHTTQPQIRTLIHEVLFKVGQTHPQALIYPLTVASKSHSEPRKLAAIKILDSLRRHSPQCATLVDQASLVSQELIRVAILWHEMWHEALEEASRLYFGQKNVEGMFQTLTPLHEMMEKGPSTLREVAFQQAFGRDLMEAKEWCDKYRRSGKESDLNQAWELYCHVFRKINKQLPQLTALELQHVSPQLLSARDLDIAVPGTYQARQKLVSFSHFAPSLRVIESKQRPRKLTIHGSDGLEYAFLLKGHEDLRQDERVMQLFGLVNTLLAHDRDTNEGDLSIKRFSAIPLSPNSGLIEWMPHTDTLHALIKEYRDSRKVMLNVEHRLIMQMAPDYNNMSLIQKVEVFEYALTNTTGQDLCKVLWLKSHNSEVWLDRRTNYTRSLAVMSMVGYVLGLGDRHPCNLMLDRLTGKLIHIDFGDCFEVAMKREKYPEKVPFRLTRMLVNAMEVSGIEGNFRFTCENVMRVLRQNKESLMAVLEAFVYDPLINWRLLKSTTAPDAAAPPPATPDATAQSNNNPLHLASTASYIEPSTFTSRTVKEDEQLNEVAEAEAGSGPSEILNEQALRVLARVSSKLRGRDHEPLPGVAGGPPASFLAKLGQDSTTAELDVKDQVQMLINQATNYENLCQCYIGWCPLW